MILIEIDIDISGTVKYHLTYEYKRGVIAYIKSVNGSTCEQIDLKKYKNFKAVLVPYSDGRMLLTLPGLSHEFVFVKTAEKRLIRFLKTSDDKLQPFGRLRIELNGTVFDGIVQYSLEGSSMKSGSLKFDTNSTQVINTLISEKLSENLTKGLLSIF